MVVAALIVSVVAIVVSVASAVYTRITAVATKGVHEIERGRRLGERRPRLAGVIERLGARSGRLRITLLSDEPLSGMDITVPPVSGAVMQGVSFKLGIFGTAPPVPGELTYDGFAYDPHSGERAGLRPRESITWAVDLGEIFAETVQIEATCYGTGGEVWDSVLVEAEVGRAIPGGPTPGFQPVG